MQRADAFAGERAEINFQEMADEAHRHVALDPCGGAANNPTTQHLQGFL